MSSDRNFYHAWPKASIFLKVFLDKPFIYRRKQGPGAKIVITQLLLLCSHFKSFRCKTKVSCAKQYVAIFIWHKRGEFKAEKITNCNQIFFCMHLPGLISLCCGKHKRWDPKSSPCEYVERTWSKRWRGRRWRRCTPCWSSTTPTSWSATARQGNIDNYPGVNKVS